MQWSSGKLWIGRSTMWALVPVAVVLELITIWQSMFAEVSEGLSAFAGMVALLFPLLGMPVIGSLVRVGDPARSERAGTEGYCTACGSDNLFMIGPGEYDCNECGYLGRPNPERGSERARRAEFANLPEAERRRSAIADLDEAERAYAEAAPLIQSGAASVGFSDRRRAQYDDIGGAASSSELERGTKLLEAANAKVGDAEAKLGLQFGIPLDIGVEYELGPGRKADLARERLESLRAARARFRV